MIVLLVVKALGSIIALAGAHFGSAGILYCYCLDNGLAKNRVAQVERIKSMVNEVTAILIAVRVLQALAVAAILAAIWWPS